ncbi:hypothetical protein DRQ18_00615 [bacterium]|nr:MAG: hypothetical protein DRQ18_00615 [bacterium]
MKRIIYGILAFGAGGFLGFFSFLLRELPDYRALEYYSPPLSTRIYDIKGRLIDEIYVERRIPVSIKEIPDTLIYAFIAVEDRDFYRHWGINLKAIIRAAIKNIIKRRIVQGGSTITQQLARNLFLTPEKSFIRKLMEALLAIKIERHYSKEEILEMYLNQIYFGAGNYGVEAASRYYFGKSVKELTLPECALLAGIPKGPAYYSPYRDSIRAKRRRNVVLHAMVEAGYITEERAEKAMRAPLGVVSREEKKPPPGPYFLKEVKRELVSLFGKEYLTKGFSVYTTMDMDLQRVVDSLVEVHLQRIERWYHIKPKSEYPDSLIGKEMTPYLQAAVVVMEPDSGFVLAMVGGRDIRHSQFNRAIQGRRQPGSSFKVFLYTAALDNGFNPSDLILDAPIIEQIQDKIYAPANFDSSFLGWIPLRKALALSRNTASLRLVKEVGVFTVIDYARRLGIRSPLQPVLSLPLGSSSVSLLEMVNAFGTIANYGVRVKPVFIKRVVDRYGNEIYHFDYERERVLDERTAYMVINMMKSVFDEGTARYARRLGFKYPAAGKTGTTNDFTDTWFIGFIPGVVCGVWVGFDVPKTIGKNATGASCALPIWVDVMRTMVDTSEVQDFPEPPGIVRRYICTETGLLATPYCPKVREEVFIEGNEPVEKCYLHGGGKIKERTPIERIEEEWR